uniref:Core Histone H2A/H2B/H3 domain-containing protein n=1 Tax=Noctiluca scintillans TaxID=2966 RepID=A0A7S1B030_NOCSC|eukprot:CAMPEP_0194494260 /NCGR_PEP_ID=MMETSP0253-20130528/12220_1 /TAXON_ID=2966 /ORGANISM="Noctiluca scintillans" /LENGTH=138 /DNA_ID=CAMNT_0039335355 /DNA_START=69 /DNA_END=485 /DNA_ORIENTATION=+
MAVQCKESAPVTKRRTTKQSKVATKLAPESNVRDEACPRRKRRAPDTYSVYLYRVLKQIHPNCTISKRGMSIMNSFMNDVFERMATESVRLLRRTGKMTLTSREVEASVRLMLPGELSRHAVHEGAKAVDKYCQHTRM